MSEPEPEQADGVEPEEVTKEGLLKLIDSELQLIASKESRAGATTWVLLSGAGFIAWKILEMAPTLPSPSVVGAATILTLSWAFTLTLVLRILEPQTASLGPSYALLEPGIRTLALFRLTCSAAELVVVWLLVPGSYATKAVLSIPPATAVVVMFLGIVATYRPLKLPAVAVPDRPFVVGTVLGLISTTWGSIVLVHALEPRAVQFALLVWALRQIIIKVLNKRLNAADEAGLRHTRKELALGVIPTEIARIRIELALLGSTTRRLLGEELDDFERAAKAFLAAQTELAQYVRSKANTPLDLSQIRTRSALADKVIEHSEIAGRALDDLTRKARKISGRYKPDDVAGVRDIIHQSRAWWRQIRSGMSDMVAAIKAHPVPDELPPDFILPEGPPASPAPEAKSEQS